MGTYSMRVDDPCTFADVGAYSARLRGRVLARVNIYLSSASYCSLSISEPRRVFIWTLLFAVVPIHHDDDQDSLSVLFVFVACLFRHLFIFIVMGFWGEYPDRERSSG